MAASENRLHEISTEPRPLGMQFLPMIKNARLIVSLIIVTTCNGMKMEYSKIPTERRREMELIRKN